VVNPDLYKGRPVPHLVEHKNKKSGRNVYGEITMRHQGGGHKQLYRKIDFKRDKDGITAKVERLEYDPNRTAFLALLCYADGERRYVIAAKGVSAGMQLVSGADAPIKTGNTLPLRNIPVGTTIHCVELLPGKQNRLGTVHTTPTAAVKPHNGWQGEWQQAQIIARGNTLVHVLNGQVVTITVDDSPADRARQGILSLQLEGSGQVWYRNVYVRPLESSPR
jgi:hypothetical protein